MIVVADYDANWPRLFELERHRILTVVGDVVVAIEHVGSTAVPGLAAKPIIDILAGVPRLADADDCIEPLTLLGYEYVPEFESAIPDRRFFRRGSGETATHHVHVVEFDGNFWNQHVGFRDHLRTHPDDAARYAVLKKNLAARLGHDREAYTDAKASFIQDILRKSHAGPTQGPASTT